MRYRIVIERVERHEVFIDSESSTQAKTKAEKELAEGRVILNMPFRIANVRIVDVHRFDDD